MCGRDSVQGRKNHNLAIAPTHNLHVYFYVLWAFCFRPENDVDPTVFHTLGNSPEFWAAFNRRYGVNPVLQNPSTRDFIFPVLQSDFQVRPHFM